MPIFQFNKLVRDKLPAVYTELNEKIVFRKLRGVELLRRLGEKLLEEVAEIPFEEGTREQIIDELSDVEQVMDDIKAQLDISDEEIRAAKSKKFAKKGGFSDGIFVETIELTDDDEWVKYYRQEPNKYAELGKSGKADPALPHIEKGTYRHNKSGNLYEVTGITFHTETNEPLVIYRPLYETKYEFFARPYAMFVGKVELDSEMKPRFEKLDNEKTPNTL